MIEKLIIEGKLLQDNIRDNNISGKEYQIWLNASIHYIESYYAQSVLTKKFIREYEAGTQESIYYFETMLGILEGLKKIDDISPPPEDYTFF